MTESAPLRRRRLPPLNSLFAFEAVGRHLNMSQAAEELGVTYSAVSHQMRTLEAHFDVPLFTAKGRKMQLSRHGQRLLETLKGSFDSIERRIIETNEIINPRHLKVAASTAIASSSIPAYSSQFIIENQLVDFTWMPLEEIDETVDVIIAYTEIPDVGEADITYLSLNYFVVCTPLLLENSAPPGTLSELNDHVFIHGDYDGAEWKRFLNILGQRQIMPRANMYLGNYLLSNRAAKNGCGLAIADELMVHTELSAGTLIRPLPYSVPAPQPARIILPARSLKNKLALHFRDWFIDMVADTLETFSA